MIYLCIKVGCLSYKVMQICLIFLLLSLKSIPVQLQELIGYTRPEHPLNENLFNELKSCKLDFEKCGKGNRALVSIFNKISNEHAALLLFDRAQEIFEDILYYVQPDNALGRRAAHTLSVLSFAQGRYLEAEKYWTYLTHHSEDLVYLRSQAAQAVMSGSNTGGSLAPHRTASGSGSGISSWGMELLSMYSTLLGQRMQQVLSYELNVSATAEAAAGAPDPYASSSSRSSKRRESNQQPLGSAASRSGSESAGKETSLCSYQDIHRGQCTVSRTPSQASGALADVGADATVIKRSSDFIKEETYINSSSSVRDSESGRYGLLVVPELVQSAPSQEVEEALLTVLLSEATGVVRSTIRVSDLILATATHLPPLDEKLRFRLGVGLSKLGLFEMSMKHVWQAATPSQSPLYKVRAVMIFAPVHTSNRALAAAVDTFEQNAERILTDRSLSSRTSPLMQRTCESPAESALALQALPLLHLAGFAAPRHTFTEHPSHGAETVIGHSPVALPVLLGEIYQHLCPSPRTVRAPVQQQWDANRDIFHGTKSRYANQHISASISRPVIRVGVVAGTMDSQPGKIIIGLLESMSAAQRHGMFLMAMCFPTPRDPNTDRLSVLFDQHVNLSPDNRDDAIGRILDGRPDFLLFADAALDSRVFAIAHERLAVWQGALWGWGGTLQMPSIDFFFVPEMMWRHSRCAQVRGAVVPPQDTYGEQVILLEGLPLTSLPPLLSIDEGRALLQARYLMSASNSTNIYLFPGSVKHLHPEFDRVIDIILKTDPVAVVVFAVVRSGRDNVPPTHIAVRHDLMHPPMPAAAVAKCLRRLRARIGARNMERVRVLPPLEDSLLRVLQRMSVVLDAFPVGFNLPVLMAMLDRVPVVSLPTAQECTSSHALNIARFLNIEAAERTITPQEHHSQSDNYHTQFPTTLEEYGVLAVQLQRDEQLRRSFTVQNQSSLDSMLQKSKKGPETHGAQLSRFLQRLINT